MVVAGVVWVGLSVHFARVWWRHRHPVAIAIAGHAFTMGVFGIFMFRARNNLIREALPYAGGLSLLASLLILAAVIVARLQGEKHSCETCGTRSWLY